ncbi:MAG: acyltransferase, partial [Lachnospiraceae bacterium]|nr:acyltransferase [Lachnospiraceae bacterium]
MTESDKNILNEGRFNYSIAFMKVFFSFCVICCHFYFPTENLEFYPKVVIGRMQSIAVPIFVTITFYFTGKALAVGSIDWIKKRMIRLLFPFWGWGILYFFGFRVIDFIVRMLGFEQGIIPDYTIKDLLWQLTLGSDRYLCPPLWYQFDLIVLMIVLWAVGRFCSKCFWGVIAVLGVLAIGAQYFGLNYL